jgi:hypothetical protein
LLGLLYDTLVRELATVILRSGKLTVAAAWVRRA